MKKIILITGGQRSGKSNFAEQMALSLSKNPIYMATAHVWDEEFAQRVRKHQERRGPEWTNIEEEFELSAYTVTGRVVLIDCCTLWATNYFSRYSLGNDAFPDVDFILKELCREFDRFTTQDATFIFVTNEIGMGGTNPNTLQRSFTDLLGWFNQYVASNANEVYFMACGIPMLLKKN